MKTVALLIRMFSVFCFITPIHASDAFGTTPAELKKLEDLNKTNSKISQTDKELASLMTGKWTTGRHDYIYRADGTWQMLPLSQGGTSGKWQIKDAVLVQGESQMPFLKVEPKRLVLKNTSGKYPFRYVRIK